MKPFIFIWILFFVFPVLPADDGQVLSETDKHTYLIYEPVYLTMTAKSKILSTGGFFGPLGDHSADVLLRIQLPTGNWINYSSPVQQECLITSEKNADLTVDECVLFSRNTIITSTPGLYHLSLFSKKVEGMALSESIEIFVAEPINEVDKEAIALIKQNINEYALFTYLNGGDHIRDGFRIVSTLAVGNSAYSHVAKTVISINFSQIYYDFLNDKIGRDRDFVKAEEHFPSAFEKQTPAVLRLAAASAIEAQMESANIYPSGLSQKVRAIKSEFAGTKYQDTWKFKKLK